MTFGGVPPGDTEAVGTEPGQDPLAGLTRPPGNPDAVQQAGKAYEAAGHELGYVSHRLKGMVDGVVGGAWIGKAGASCQAAVGDVASAHAEAGTLTHDAAAALQKCAATWRPALDSWQKARDVADDVVQDERRRRRELRQEAEELFKAGNDLDARLKLAEAQTYEDPRRDQVWKKANEAVEAYDRATHQASSALEGTMRPLQGLLDNIDLYGGAALTEAEAISRHNLRVPRWAKWFGRGTVVLSFATAAAARHSTDLRKYPNMDLDERLGRAFMEGFTVTIGSALGSAGGAFVGAGLGALGGAAVGGPVGLVAGAIAGGIAGGMAGGMVGGGLTDRYNDPAVDWFGNWTDKIDQLGPWG